MSRLSDRCKDKIDFVCHSSVDINSRRKHPSSEETVTLLIITLDYLQKLSRFISFWSDVLYR